MNNNADNNLDRMLKDWAGRTTWPEERRRRVEATISEAVGRDAELGRSEAVEPLPAGIGLRLAYLGAGVALAAVIFAVAHHHGFFPANGSSSGLAREDASRARSVRVLFEESNQLFDHNLRWVSQTGKDVKMEVGPSGWSRNGDSEPVAIHIGVIARSSGDSKWRSVWETDIVGRSQDVIEVVPDSKGGNRLVLWLLPLGDGRVAMDSRLDLALPVRVNAETSEILENGKPCKIISIRQGDTEYRVIQTVTRLPVGRSTSC